ncbi:Hypp9625, partial [Branchiostoma lanceolatum]
MGKTIQALREKNQLQEKKVARLEETIEWKEDAQKVRTRERDDVKAPFKDCVKQCVKELQGMQVGEETSNIYRNLAPDDTDDFAGAKERLNTHFEPQVNKMEVTECPERIVPIIVWIMGNSGSMLTKHRSNITLSVLGKDVRDIPKKLEEHL